MIRFCAASLLAITATVQALPPEPMPISPAAAPRGSSLHYFDDVEGLARLAWQATRCPDDRERLAAVEQMVRCCVHPRRADTVLATVEANDANPIIRQAALRVRVQLRLETESLASIEREEQMARGRSVVAHDPIPYREALASLRSNPEWTASMPCPCLTPPTMPAVTRSSN